MLRKAVSPSLRGAKRRSNPDLPRGSGLLRFARNDGEPSAAPCRGTSTPRDLEACRDGPVDAAVSMSHQDRNTKPSRSTSIMADPHRARPKPTPETQHLRDGTKAAQLRLP